ncbi:unnamed protein product [Schistocephalus solidus]|uniref:Reverse transcriptase domain-containing protein n=1 Tax=Schistocephalus solidus TaxID=70667 RepID=A0A183SIM6_SCHSO|nr:unnamed protein product [Schistocephalus solidus]
MLWDPHRLLDGRKLFNRIRMHLQTHASRTTVHERLFIDDCTLNATKEGDMQRSPDVVGAACDNFGLTINSEKTVVMHQPPTNTTYNAPYINVNGAQLQAVDTLTYLDSTFSSINLSRSTQIDDEMAHWIFKASQTFVACRTSSGIVTVSTSAPNTRSAKLLSCRCCRGLHPEPTGLKADSEDGHKHLNPTGSPTPRPKVWHKSHQQPGPTPTMPKSAPYARAVNATFARKSAWSYTFGCNARIIRQPKLLRQLLLTLLWPPDGHP